jgi:hypothetical protein
MRIWEGIDVHCTAGRPTATVAQIDAYHRAPESEGGRAFKNGIGYNWLIHEIDDGSGEWIWSPGRSMEIDGAHCLELGHNHTHLSVSVAGNYELHELPEKALECLIDFLVWITVEKNIPIRKIGYHRKVQIEAGVKNPKACPGKHIIDKWDYIIEEVKARHPLQTKI